MKHRMTTLVPLTIAVMVSSPLMASSYQGVVNRLDESTTVLSEIMSAPDRNIPRDLLERAHCVVVVPGLKKGAFVIGAEYGKGFISCRTADRRWSSPGAVRIEGGSFGLQAGGSETDLVLLVMNERGARRLLGSRFTIGGEGAVAAGPVGRSAAAETDARMTAEILAWSRSRGVFAGVSLKGATLREDMPDNVALYSRRISNSAIVSERVAFPQAAVRLQAFLEQYPSRER